MIGPPCSVHPSIRGEVFFQRDGHTRFLQGKSLSCMVQLDKSFLKWSAFSSMRILPVHEGFGNDFHSLWMMCHQSSVHSIKRQVRLQFCVEATNRTGNEDYWPLTVACIQAVYENNVAALYAVYTWQHSDRGWCHMQPHECQWMD
jgi:hypothetical protein